MRDNEHLALSAHDRKLITILEDLGIDISPMACEFSRQQGDGVGKFKGAMRSFGDGTYRISYDLILCTYCGNLLPQRPCCPAKFARFTQQLIQQYLAAQVTSEVSLLHPRQERLLLTAGSAA